MISLEGYRQLELRVPWTAVWVLVIVGGIELGFGLVVGSASTASALEWHESPKALSARVRFLEREVAHGEARLVVLGSSRAAMGIHPPRLEQTLDLPESSIWNLGLIGGGRPFDTRHLAERFLPRVKKWDWVVIAVDEFTLNRAHAHGELFRDHAPLLARWSESDSPWSASLDGVSRLRRDVPKFLDAARSYEAGARDLDLWLTPSRQVRFRSWGDRSEVVTRESAQRIADRYFRDFELNRSAGAHLRSIVNQVRARGGRCVFVTLPSHPEFRAAVEETYGEELKTMWAALQSISAEVEVPWIRFDSREYPASWFRDAVHLTEAGSEAFTADLGEALRVL